MTAALADAGMVTYRYWLHKCNIALFHIPVILPRQSHYECVWEHAYELNISSTKVWPGIACAAGALGSTCLHNLLLKILKSYHQSLFTDDPDLIQNLILL
jgi:hypothetical protein